MTNGLLRSAIDMLAKLVTIEGPEFLRTGGKAKCEAVNSNNCSKRKRW